MKKTFFAFLFLITNFGLNATAPGFVNHGDSTLETLKCYGNTQQNEFDEVSAAKDLENWLNEQLETLAQFGIVSPSHPTKPKSAPDKESTTSVKNDIDNIMDLIAKTSKITKKDLEHKLPDIIIETKIVNEDGVVFLPVIEIAGIAGTNYSYDVTKEIVTFKNEKSTVEMLVKQVSIFRNDTLFLPVSKIKRAFEDYNFRVERDKTVKVSPPFKSKVLLVGTKNSNIDNYGASMSVISTKYYSMFYYDTLEQAEMALERFLARDDVDYAEFDEIIPFNEPEPEYDSFRATTEENIEAKEAVNLYKYMDAYEKMPGKKKDVIVAVLDSGFDSTDPIFDNMIVAGYNVADNNLDFVSTYFHGTFVAGIVAQFSPMINIKNYAYKSFLR